MNKKLLSVALCLCLVSTSANFVHAVPQSNLSDQYNNAVDKNKKDQADYNNAKEKSKQLEQQIEGMDSQIEAILRKINDNKVQITKTQNEIGKAEADIKQAEEDTKAEQEIFNKRMKALYMTGNNGYLEILMDSDGISDFITKVEAVKKIAELDDKTVNDLKQKKAEITKKKDALNNENKRLLALKADNEKKLADLNKAKADQDVLLAQNKAIEKKLGSDASDSKAVVDKLKKELAAAASNNNSGTTASRGNFDASKVTGNNADVVLYALNFRGRPYVWGANGPDSFDCSGFVIYVYARFGVGFNGYRTTYDMCHVGKLVSQSEMLPGDVIYFGPPSDVHHVGMYVGDGMFIHAPQRGDVVKVSPLSSRSDIYCIRRMR